MEVGITNQDLLQMAESKKWENTTSALIAIEFYISNISYAMTRDEAASNYHKKYLTKSHK